MALVSHPSEETKLLAFDRSLRTSIDSTYSLDQEVSSNICCKKFKDVFKKKERYWSVCYASLVATLGSLSFGYGYGFISPALLQLTDKTFVRNVSEADFSPEVLQDTFGGLLSAGAAIGGLTFGTVADTVGRKTGIMIMSLCFLVGWSVTGVSRLLQTTAFFGVIYTGVFIVGYGCGSATLVVPMYISEISPAHLRGLLGCLPEVFTTLGILLVFALGSIPSNLDFYQDFPYYYLAAIGFGIAALNIVLLFTVRESPHWLILKQRIGSACESIRWLRGPNINIEAELQTIREGLSVNRELSYIETLKLLPKRAVGKPLFIVVAVLSFQELIGITAITFYGGPIFRLAGFANANQVAAGSIGVISVIFSTVALILSDVLGRKVLLLVGSAIVTLATSATGVYFYIYTAHDCSNLTTSLNATTDDIVCNRDFGWLAIMSIGLYIFGFSISWGPIPFLLSSELFPTAVRGKCMSIGTFVNWGLAVIISFTFNSYRTLVYPFGAFWTFTGFSFLSFFFVLIFLPETKGKTLHEIEKYFAGKQQNSETT